MKPSKAGLIALALVLLTSCGTTEPDGDAASPEGVWLRTVPGVLESTVRFEADGGFTRVRADLAAEQCDLSLGDWSIEAGVVVARISEVAGVAVPERLDFEVVGGLLRTLGSPSESYEPVPRASTCVEYGWGVWEGTLTALVDGAPRSFDDVRVLPELAAGRLTVTALASCAGCPAVPELVLGIDSSPDPLEPRGFTVQNTAGARFTFSAFYHPAPGDPDFDGFSTDRLSPTGVFTLTRIAPDRVAGTFEFRGNPTADGQVAPDGRTTVEITGGAVDLTYR